jgi:hypothetical protein
MQSRDYIERMLQQIAELVARLFTLVAGGRFDDAERELDAIWASALGFRRADAERLDDATLRALLGGKATAAARLFEAESKLEEARGNAAAAERLRQRAARLTD